MPQKILFLVPYPLKESPSQRFRFEQYFQLLEQNGYQISVQAYLNSGNWQVFYEYGKLVKKMLAFITGFVKRIIALSYTPFYDFVFIHREAMPLGPPVFEWIIAKVLRKKIIYDFDDAIWLTDRSAESGWMDLAKWRSKVSFICKWSYKVSCGNEYLCSFARKVNANVILNPTTIDTTLVHNPELFKIDTVEKDHVVIGWTGSHSTLKYFESVAHVLHRVETKFPDIRIIVVADRQPDVKLNTLRFIPWEIKSEIEDLMTFDIGIMPLPDDLWAKGKCGFKALQYMALKIPAVASLVGVNSQIIDHGKNGFLCSTSEEWMLALSNLIENQSLRIQMGESGRQKVINRYSVESNSELFLKLFE